MPRRKPVETPTDDEILKGEEMLKGHGVKSLGPSDSSDTGADMMGLGRADDTSDRYGTGERASADDDLQSLDAADISADRLVDADHAGLGDGLDEAEEAQLGITDEELVAMARRRRRPPDK